MDKSTDLDLIREAYSGSRGDDQKRIAETGLRLVATLLRKNRDYGSSAWQPPMLAPGVSVRDALRCRMSDKVQRISQLAESGTAEVDESIDETIGDLAGYGILYLGAPE